MLRQFAPTSCLAHSAAHGGALLPLCCSFPRGKASPHFSETLVRLRACGGTREACRIVRSPHPVPQLPWQHLQPQLRADLSPKVLVPLAFSPRPRSHVWPGSILLIESGRRRPAHGAASAAAQLRLPRQGPSLLAAARWGVSSPPRPAPAR